MEENVLFWEKGRQKNMGKMKVVKRRRKDFED